MRVITSLFCMMLFLLAGCSDNQHKKAVEQIIAATKAKAPQPLPPLPIIKTYPIPHYEVAGLRSPFQPNLVQVLGHKRMKEPLEKFSLDSLHLVGIITRSNDMWGLIAAPDGKIYQITVGDHLGLYEGRVIAIHKGHLDVAEAIPNGDNSVEQHTTLTLSSNATQPAKTP